jgi:predicted nuclease of predicted toxin-antitoxin system
MRFKTDENLHPGVAKFLQEHGHDAVTVWDQRLRGSSDARIIERCRTERRALLTLDVGFSDFRAYPPENYFGIVVLRLKKQSRKHVLRLLLKILDLLRTEPLEKRLWIVDEKTMRVRGSESEPGKK